MAKRRRRPGRPSAPKPTTKQRAYLVALMTEVGDDPTFAWKITDRADMSNAIDAYRKALATRAGVSAS